MKKPMVKIHNIETGEIIEREFDDAEMAAYEEDNLKAAQQVEAEAKAKADKAAAQAKLEALGLTADDLKALGL